MNNRRPGSKAAGTRRRRWAGRGQSYVEFAFALPVLAFILIIVATLGRLFYTYIGVINAARAGAQYGSNSVITAADTSGMEAAAQKDGANVANLTVTASQCTCGTVDPPSLPACASSYCTVDPQGNYVIVNTQAPFSIVLKFPGVPSSITLTGQAVMQVQQQ
jgi:Flp pilus assembly protein TadG